MKKTAIILLTKKCNKTCFYCYEGMSSTRTRLMLDTDVIKNFITVLKNKFAFEKIIYTGGEPSLHPDFLQIIEFTSSLNLKILIFTNGQLMNLRNISDVLLSSSVTEIRFSLNEFADIADEESYLAIEKRVLLFVSKISPFQKIILNVIFSALNIKYLSRIKDLCNQLKIGMYIQAVTIAKEHNKFNAYSLTNLSDDNWMSLNKFALNEGIEYTPYISLLSDYYKNGSKPTACSMPPIVVLTPEGNLHPCLFLFNHHILNIHENTDWAMQLESKMRGAEHYQNAKCFSEDCLCMFKSISTNHQFGNENLNLR